MEYQGRNNTDDLVLAIEALGYDEESRGINSHLNYHLNIIRDSFCRRLFKNVEGVGSKFEGLHDCLDHTNDIDFVHNCPEMPVIFRKKSDKGFHLVKETINAEKDLRIMQCLDFPGYVKLKLLTSILEYVLIPNNIFHIINDVAEQKRIEVGWRGDILQNGPAATIIYGEFNRKDLTKCFLFKSWPAEAEKWATRNKPNNWPSKTVIKKIKSKGFNLAPVGHYDSSEKAFQWRIGIRGEKELMFNLNETQMLCYIALRLILKGDIKLIHEDALSSYHMKNVIFWCVEQENCEWTKENFEICLKTCINRLVRFITCNQFPHYFIEHRNLLNSKMTFELRERMIKSLSKYSSDIAVILSLNAFDELKESTRLKVELLEWVKQKTIIILCFKLYIITFLYFSGTPNDLWEIYTGHNTAINVKNAEYTLSILKKRKMYFIHHHIAYAKNMLGLLLYSRYFETRCKNDILKARKLLRSSLTFENVSLKFRVATFYFMQNEFDDSLGMCNSYLSNPSKYKTEQEKMLAGKMLLSDITTLIKFNTSVSKLTEIKNKMLSIFYNKFLSENCGDGRLFEALTVSLLSRNLTRISVDEPTKFNSILHFISSFANGTSYDDLLLIFKNFTNMFFRDMSFNVPYLAAEKWAVPRVIQYELLSVKRCHPQSCIYGIYLDPMLNCLVLTFLCYHETRNMKKRDEMLSKMCHYINDYTKCPVDAEMTHSLPLYRVYNIVANCCVKAGRYQQALTYILNSCKLHPRRENAAYGYIRCVCSNIISLR